MTGFAHSFSNTEILGRKLVEKNFSLFSHLGIAMASDDPAKETQDSSFGKTNVAVYHCENNACESGNYNDCAKIGETQPEGFSNEIIQLVTSDTHITMCFHQGNTLPEGIYAVFWTKDRGAGHSCGILNYEGMLCWEPG